MSTTSRRPATNPARGRPWLDTLWQGVKLAWEREAGKEELRQKEEVRQGKRQLSVREQILEGAREWCCPILDDARYYDDGRLWDWLSERMILSRENKFYVLDKTGYYHAEPVRQHMLQAHIRRLRMDEHLDFWIYSGEDDEKTRTERPVSKLLSVHASPVDGIVGRANLPGAHFECDCTRKSKLVVPLFALRTDIKPKYDADVNEWLHIF